MSSMSDSTECYKCGGVMMTYYQNKPHDFISGECVECGYAYYTVDEQLSLDDVNAIRKDNELDPIKELKEQEV